MPYLAIFASSWCWAIATQIFSHLGRQISVFRLNLYKAFFSLGLFVIAGFFFNDNLEIFQKLTTTHQHTLAFLLISGTLGFAVGDLFIFRAFAKIGAARSLMVQAFSPTLVAVYSYVLLGSLLEPRRILGLGFLFVCLFFLSLDKRQKIPFSWMGAGICFIGIALDSLGVVFSKLAFNSLETLDSGEANIYRLAIALPVLLFLTRAAGRPLGFKDIPKKIMILIFVGSFFGTFMALYFYLYSISKLEPAVVVGIASITPIYASIIEHVRDRIVPSPYFYVAIASMFGGVYFILP